jgi:hypothetical protein
MSHRSTTKTGKHTKAALEQPISDVSNGSQSSGLGNRTGGSSNNGSTRHPNSEQSHKSKQSKQQSRDKVSPRPTAMSKQRRNQLERPLLRGMYDSIHNIFTWN